MSYIHTYLDFASRVRPPARHPSVAGFRYAVLRAALYPRSTLPPPRRVGLRFPTPVGHGRGLASRPGLSRSGGRHRFRQAFIHARRTALVKIFLHDPSASTGPASFRADPDHASSFSSRPNCSKKPPPRLINQSRSRPDRRHSIYRQTPRRCISDNI